MTYKHKLIILKTSLLQLSTLYFIVSIHESVLETKTINYFYQSFNSSLEYLLNFVSDLHKFTFLKSS